MSNKITYDPSKVSEWKAVSSLTSSGERQRELDDQFSRFGVYQVAEQKDLEDIGDNIIHPSIGYTGKSDNIHDRTYKIRQSANSRTGNNSHGAGRYIRQNNLDVDSVFVRYIYCESKEECVKLEQSIHEACTKQFGQRFKWKEASAGKDGDFNTVTTLIDRMSNTDRRNLILYASDLIKEDLFSEFMDMSDAA